MTVLTKQGGNFMLEEGQAHADRVERRAHLVRYEPDELSLGLQKRLLGFGCSSDVKIKAQEHDGCESNNADCAKSSV